MAAEGTPATAAEQADEVEALQAIFEEELEVISLEPGAVALALQLEVEFPALSELNVAVDIPCEPHLPHDEASGLHDSAVAASDLSVEELAAERLRSSVKQPEAPTLRRSTSGGHTRQEMVVEHLPPITLQLAFPPSYPSEAPPDFHLECPWLSSKQLARLCEEMDLRAADLLGSPVVFIWAEMLKGESAELLGLTDSTLLLEFSIPSDDPRAVAEDIQPSEAFEELALYAARRKLELWHRSVQTCQICFSDFAGSRFVQLGGCTHAFCWDCVSQMCELHVKEGSIVELRCPDPKCRADIAPSALEKVLDDDAYDRWYGLRMEKILSAELEGVIFCPSCEDRGERTPVLSQPTSDEAEAPLCMCKRCGYVFCGNCLDIYHPSLDDCASAEEVAMKRAMNKTTKAPLSRSEQRKMKKAQEGVNIDINPGDDLPRVDALGCLTEEYGTAQAGDEVHCVFEWKGRTFWRRNKHALEALEEALRQNFPPFVILVKANKAAAAERLKNLRIMEELMSLRAIKANSRNCPRCHIIISRSAGCNHMNCVKCGCHFCYQCGKEMNASDPYSHFRGGSCQTFDDAEVQRIAVQQREDNARGVDQELAALRQQFGDQEALFAQFEQHGARAARGGRDRRMAGRRMQVQQRGDARCPTCGTWGTRMGMCNHIRCSTCRTNFCASCKKRITGVVTAHFKDGGCRMHVDPVREPAAQPAA